MKKLYTVYMLRCADGSLYTGIARDVAKRLAQHLSGKGSVYVRARLPATIVYTEVHDGRSAATKREVAIKRLSKKDKEILIIYKNI
jgi:predicted GIY-YIG superfamily endonuclease